MRMSTCIQCGATWPRGHVPESMLDESGREMSWCSAECDAAWFAADPRRREGWVRIGDDLAADAEAFAAIGLRLTVGAKA